MVRLVLISFIIISYSQAGKSQSGDNLIRGYVKYDNTEASILQQVKVYLTDLGGNKLDSTTTNLGGYFVFYGVSLGSFRLITEAEKPWGGVSTNDALLAFRHFVEMDTLEGMSFLAADADGNHYVNATDAMAILARVTGVRNSLPAGDWCFEQPIVNTGVAPAMVFIRGRCRGDIDGSHSPVIIPGFNCGTTLVDSRNSEIYPTVQIGSQCWTAKSMNIGTQIQGNQAASNNQVIEKYCYNNIPENCRNYGGLYDWNEMMQYAPNEGAQGICPAGWHVPTDNEWCTMLNALEPGISCTQTGLLGMKVGGKLKEAGYEHWNSPNTDATNEVGFAVLGAGMGYNNNFFTAILNTGAVWTSTQHTYQSNAWYRSFSANHGQVMRNGSSKSNRISVRCILD